METIICVQWGQENPNPRVHGSSVKHRDDSILQALICEKVLEEALC